MKTTVDLFSPSGADHADIRGGQSTNLQMGQGLEPASETGDACQAQEGTRGKEIRQYIRIKIYYNGKRAGIIVRVKRNPRQAYIFDKFRFLDSKDDFRDCG